MLSKEEFKELLKPDDEVKGIFYLIIILVLIYLFFSYIVFPNISGTSNYEEECVPNYMGGCDL